MKKEWSQKNNFTCLDPKYSTTRMLTQVSSQETITSSNNRGIIEGGLRKKGYYKSSYPSKPLVTIITPVYNRVNFLEKAIKSVILQDYDNVEYIIIDGGSTDGTLDVIKRYDENIDYWISGPDDGMYDALNVGLQCMRGDIWGCLNSDDYYVLNSVISRVVFSFEEIDFDCDLIFGNLVLEDKGYFVRRKLFDINRNILLSSGHSSFLPHPTTFLTRNVFLKVGFFDTRYKYSADYDYFLKALKGFSVKHVDTDIACFVVHESSLTISNLEEKNLERKKIIKTHSVNSCPQKLLFLCLKFYGWAKYFFKNPHLIKRQLKKIFS